MGLLGTSMPCLGVSAGLASTLAGTCQAACGILCLPRWEMSLSGRATVPTFPAPPSEMIEGSRVVQGLIPMDGPQSQHPRLPTAEAGDPPPS